MSGSFAEKHPVAFSLLATVAFLVGIIAVSAIGARGSTPLALEASGTVGRAVLALAAGFALYRICGISVLDPRRAGWFAAIPVLLYVVAVYPALLNGDYRLNFDAPRISTFVAANGFAAGVLEELVFRGIVLRVLLGSPTGPPRVARGIVLSSLLFSLPHALNIFTGEDRVRVLAQLFWSFLLGIVFASLVIAYRNVWPIAAVHGLANAFVHLNRYGRPSQLGAVQAVLLAAAPLSLVAYGLLQLRRQLRRTAPQEEPAAIGEAAGSRFLEMGSDPKS